MPHNNGIEWTAYSQLSGCGSCPPLAGERQTRQHLSQGSYFFGSGIPTRNMLDQFVVSRGLYYGTSGLQLKRRIRLEPAEQQGDPPVVAELDTVWADVFDSDLMVTSQHTRRPKRFEFNIENGVATHNDGFSDHFPIVTTIGSAR